MTVEPLIRFEGISKRYSNGTEALKGVSFSIEAGTIHAICGENGAGKSTLMKVLFGLDQPTAGTIHIDGRPADISSPRAAASLGISMVHQHFSLLPSLTVAENILLGQEPRKGLLVDRKAARERIAALTAKYNLEADAEARVADLSVAAQQKVEILKALSRDVRILILDEPTAVLTPLETDKFFRRLLGLKATGITILFISHKLGEVRALADRVTTLRAGLLSGDASMSEISDAEIATLVMGATKINSPQREPHRFGAERLRIDNLILRTNAGADRLNGVSLSIRAGEVLGIAGVDGSGQRGLVSVLNGEVEPHEGDFFFEGRSVRGQSTAMLRKHGMAHLPADRFRQGGARTLSLADNAIAGAHRSKRFSWGAFLRKRQMETEAQRFITDFSIRCPGPRAPLSALSGGNAQKVIAAREFAANPTFLIADQPTRGIDIASAAFLQGRILDMARQGTAVLLISADLDELLALSDRVAVLFAGRIAAVFENGPELTPGRLGPFMLGLERAA